MNDKTGEAIKSCAGIVVLLSRVTSLEVKKTEKLLKGKGGKLFTEPELKAIKKNQELKKLFALVNIAANKKDEESYIQIRELFWSALCLYIEQNK